MTHLPLAFSIHHFISSVGADAGFASIIGLAILVFLYFAQARETATLRERADGAEQRSAQLEARLSQVAQATRAPAQAQPTAPRPVPSPIARPLANLTPAARPAIAGAPGTAPVAVPAAPAGVGAPALTSATRLIPLSAAAASAPAESTPAQSEPAPVAAQAEDAPEPVAASGPAPATAAGVASATAVVAPPAPATPDTGNGSGDDTSSDPLFDDEDHEPLPRVQLRPGGGGSRHLPPLRQPPSSRGPSRFGRGLAAVLAALAVAIVIAVLLIVTSGGGKSNPSSSTSSNSNAPAGHQKSKGKTFDRRAVTVTVLNGTGTSGLAARILTQLGNAGFKAGTSANAANATQATSIVAYLTGQKVAAQQVAKALKLPSSAVTPIDSNTQSIACPQTTCNVDVVVTVGQDLVGH